MSGEQTIYISSSACVDIYNDNTVDRFTNRLSSPITLNPNIEYEMGLVSILYPSEYYAIDSNEESMFVTILTKTPKEGIMARLYTYKCGKNILAGDIENIISTINEELLSELSELFSKNYRKYIKK